jgi:hypothetical protein
MGSLEPVEAVEVKELLDDDSGGLLLLTHDCEPDCCCCCCELPEAGDRVLLSDGRRVSG